jgi:hypothetical protein
LIGQNLSHLDEPSYAMPGLAETGISLSYGPGECTCLHAINTDSKKRHSFVAPLFAAGRTFGTICHQI